MTATITFELLGVSNTIPSTSDPSSATFTSSPAPIDSIAASVLGQVIFDLAGYGRATPRTPDPLGARTREPRSKTWPGSGSSWSAV